MFVFERKPMGRGAVLKRLIGCVLVSAVAVALASCGGGSGDQSSTSSVAATTTTKADYLAEANAICRKTADTLRPQFTQAFRQVPPNPDDLLSFLDDLSPIYGQAVEQLAAIPVPAGEEAQVAQVNKAAADDADRINAALGDPKAAEKLLSGGLFPSLYKASVDYGIAQCASVTDPKAVPSG